MEPNHNICKILMSETMESMCKINVQWLWKRRILLMTFYFFGRFNHPSMFHGGKANNNQHIYTRYILCFHHIIHLIPRAKIIPCCNGI